MSSRLVSRCLYWAARWQHVDFGSNGLFTRQRIRFSLVRFGDCKQWFVSHSLFYSPIMWSAEVYFFYNFELHLVSRSGVVFCISGSQKYTLIFFSRNETIRLITNDTPFPRGYFNFGWTANSSKTLDTGINERHGPYLLFCTIKRLPKVLIYFRFPSPHRDKHSIFYAFWDNYSAVSNVTNRWYL